MPHSSSLRRQEALLPSAQESLRACKVSVPPEGCILLPLNRMLQNAWNPRALAEIMPTLSEAGSIEPGGRDETALFEPSAQPYGDRTASVKDAFGNHWYLATQLRETR